jgi:hypothetical protein
VFKQREELRVVYNAKLKLGSTSRRVFICRSHGLPTGHLKRWLVTELEHLKCNMHKRLPYYFGSKKCMEDPPKVVQIRHNDTGADMNAVATFQQEHPHCHLVMYAMLRYTISPPMYPVSGEV